MVERTPSYVCTVTDRQDPWLLEFKRRISSLRAYIKRYNNRFEYFVRFPRVKGVRMMSRLGKDNPNAKLYRKNGRLSEKGRTGNYRSVDATRWDVYVTGDVFLAGYDIICKRDIKPKLDDQNRLHSSKGPAFAFAGFAFYYWHGVQIPPLFLKKGYLKPNSVFEIRNSETRRVAIEILGWVKILDLMDHKVIDRDPDPQIGELVEIFPDESGKAFFGMPRKLLRVKCGTGRDFAIPVLPTITTAMEAQAWMWDLPVKDFIKPEVRT